MASCFVALVPAESLTWTVKVLLPGVADVRERTPEALIERPAGRVPDVTLHWLPPVPPPAASVCAYAASTVPLGRDEVVIVSAAGSIVMASCFVAVVPAESLTWAVKLLLVAVV